LTDAPQTPRILVIEDDTDQRELICEALQAYYEDEEGLNVIGVPCGQEALREDLSGYDVVIQDCNLPDINGLDLIERILDREDLPIIMVTGENVAATAAEAIRRGAQDYVVKLGDYLFALPVMVDKNIRLHRIKLDNRRLQDELQSMLGELREKNAQLEDSLKRVQELATTDHLTGLANRRQFGELLERLYSEAARYDFDLSCCMCDLDHYKHINDTFGHQVGDQLLVTASEIIRESLRASDVAARYGGDEFVLLLPHTSLEQALSVAGRIRAELNERTRADAEMANLGVTMSIGVASLATDAPASADALVSMADRALYAAKEAGKDRIISFLKLHTTA
jgi:diguanylate cyclase (GGDEF)-like protein